MKHLGDITKINGAEIEPVDIIVGGSPCQDLSVAGKRAGLDGERSGLFMEQIRIVREMRNESIKRADKFIRPRYMLWENVPGAFSSNKAEDFRCVLEETAKIADGNAAIPRPPKNKWATAGCVMGNGWSIAWRVQDAQFWGVPQRRRRIALIADFGGQSAPEILFERESVPWNFAESGAEREGTAGDVKGGAGETSGVKCLNPDHPQSARIYSTDGVFHSLNANENGGQSRDAILCFAQNQRDEVRDLHDVAGSLAAEPGMKQQTYVVGFSYKASAHAGTVGCADNLAPSLLGARHDAAICIPINDKATRYQGGGDTRNHDGSGNGLGIGQDGDPAPTLTSGDKRAVFDARGNGETYQNVTGPLMANSHPGSYCGQDAYTDMLVAAVDCRSNRETSMYPTLQSKPNGGQSLNYSGAVRTNMSVRRLTPLECERLQGYPDGWTDIIFRNKPASDSARYKSLGNSIALPPWRFVLGRIYQHGARTLGSLFDGLGGFPYVWRELPGTYTTWASEIEPFCIAVTEYHFTPQSQLECT